METRRTLAVTLPSTREQFSLVNDSRTFQTLILPYHSGTSLIGVAPSLLGSLYSQIPGAAPGTGNLAQFFVIPCSTNVSVSLTFGGVNYSIDSADFVRFADDTRQTCIGGEY